MANGHGGARRGAGAKKSRLTREIALRAAVDGMTPIEVMLTIMRAAMQAEEPDHGKALAAAQAAAPYIHPRLSTQTVEVKSSVSDMSDDELKAALLAKRSAVKD